MKASPTSRIVLAVFGCSAGIALAGFASAAWTGSASLAAMALLAAVISVHQSLALFGLSRSKRKTDDRFPFGYDPDLYFWSAAAGIMIFSATSAALILDGMSRLEFPRAVTSSPWPYVLFACGFVLAFAVAKAAVEELIARRERTSLLASLRSPDDPALQAAVAESFALAGSLAIAAFAVSLADLAKVANADASGALAIGLLAVCLSISFVITIRDALAGRSAGEAIEKNLIQIIKAETGSGMPLEALNSIRTIRIGPEDVVVMADVTFHSGISAQHAAAIAARLGRAMRARNPQVSRVFIESRSLEASGNLIPFDPPPTKSRNSHARKPH